MIDPYHPNIPSQAQLQLGKKILRGFQNAIEYLRGMVSAFRTHFPCSILQINCGVFVCMRMLMFLKTRFTNNIKKCAYRAMLAFLQGVVCMSISWFSRFHGEYSLCFKWWITCQDLCISHLYNLSVLCVCVCGEGGRTHTLFFSFFLVALYN